MLHQQSVKLFEQHLKDGCKKFADVLKPSEDI